VSGPVDAAEARVRAAVAAGDTPSLDDVREVLAALDDARATAAERWTAIGLLAPKAKELRVRVHELERALAATRTPK